MALVARAAEPHPSLPQPVIPDCLGVNIHFTDPKPGELEMLAAAGLSLAVTDPEKLRAAQEAAARIAPPPRVPRVRKPLPPVSNEPLVQVETTHR